ncbi:MAG: 3'-5' exonuclease [Gammaproteobacteria bacterium]|nr:3'-5' exonuclease [Gammaproteobacteria bacterium]
MNESKQNLQTWATALAQDPDYKVLQRYHKVERYSSLPDDDTELRLGAVVDVETTGLDAKKDQVIELAVVQFEFSRDGRVFRVLNEFDQLQDPGEALTPLVQQLTGLTDDDVKDQAIDHDQLRKLIEPVGIVIAHNANFDRQFLESFDDIFVEKAWGCSMSDIDWMEAGIESPKLDYLAYQFGFFYDRHRALTDALATLHLLAQPFPQIEDKEKTTEDHSGSVLKQLLDCARQSNYRVWAIDAPFERKDELKARGYRWSSGADGRPKAWFIDTADRQSEVTYLQNKIFGRDVAIKSDEITAFNRYSSRA